MDTKYLIRRDTIPYPCIIIKRDEVSEVELEQIVNTIMTKDPNEKKFEVLSDMPKQTDTEEMVAVIIQKEGSLICIGNIRPIQVEVFTNIFKEEIEGYYTEDIHLSGVDNVKAVLGDNFS